MSEAACCWRTAWHGLPSARCDDVDCGQQHTNASCGACVMLEQPLRTLTTTALPPPPPTLLAQQATAPTARIHALVATTHGGLVNGQPVSLASELGEALTDEVRHVHAILRRTCAGPRIAYMGVCINASGRRIAHESDAPHQGMCPACACTRQVRLAANPHANIAACACMYNEMAPSTPHAAHVRPYSLLAAAPGFAVPVN